MGKQFRLQVVFALFVLCFTGCTDLFILDISDDRVVAVTPQEGVTLESGEIAFVWKPLEGADQYHVVVVSPSFDKIERYVNDVTTADCMCTVTLTAGSYQWYVEGTNYAYTSRAEIISFNVADNEE